MAKYIRQNYSTDDRPTADHESDVVTSMSFSNDARTPSAGEQRSQSSVRFTKSADVPHPGCKMPSSKSDTSILYKSLTALLADFGGSPLKSTRPVESNMSIRCPCPSNGVPDGRLQSPLCHSILSDTSTEDASFGAGAELCDGNMTGVLEMPVLSFGRKYIGWCEAVTCEACGGGASTAVAGRSKNKSTLTLNSIVEKLPQQMGTVFPLLKHL